MDKKSVDMNKKLNIDSNRSELEGKVAIKETTKRKSKSKAKVDLDQTIAMEAIKLDGKAKKHTEEEKRSEIKGKFGNNSSKKVSNSSEVKKIKSRKVGINDYRLSEEVDDKVVETEESVSLAMIAMFVVFCLVVCFVIGYMLYRIALTNSNTMAFIFRTFGF